MDNNFDRLQCKPWTLLNVIRNGEQEKLIAKFSYRENGYLIVVSDNESILTEALSSKEVKDRSTKLNSRLEAPVKSIIHHLKKSFEDNNLERLSVNTVSSGIEITISNCFRSIPFHWVFECKTAKCGYMKSLIVNPLITTVGRLALECEQLKKLIRKKDIEIEDYRESGAAVSRAHLKTETFSEDDFLQKLRKLTEYAATVTKHPADAITESQFSKDVIISTQDSNSVEIRQVLITNNSPSKVMGSKDQSKISPNKLTQKRKRKLKPEYRGCYITDESDSDTPANNNVQKSKISKIPVVNTSKSSTKRKNKSNKPLFKT